VPVLRANSTHCATSCAVAQRAIAIGCTPSNRGSNRCAALAYDAFAGVMSRSPRARARAPRSATPAEFGTAEGDPSAGPLAVPTGLLDAEPLVAGEPFLVHALTPRRLAAPLAVASRKNSRRLIEASHWSALWLVCGALVPGRFGTGLPPDVMCSPDLTRRWPGRVHGSCGGFVVGAHPLSESIEFGRFGPSS